MGFNYILYLISSLFICLSSSCHSSQCEENRHTATVRTYDILDEAKLDKTNNALPDTVKFNIEKDTLYMPIKHVRFEIINETGRKVMTDERYSIERFVDDRWIKCQRKYNTVVDDIGIEIMPKGNYSFTLNLSNVKGGYIEGKYRVCKTIKVDNKSKLIDCVFYVK